MQSPLCLNKKKILKMVIKKQLQNMVSFFQNINALQLFYYAIFFFWVKWVLH